MTRHSSPETQVNQALTYLIASGIGLVIPLFTVPIVTRWLTPQDYGVVALGQLVATLFLGFVNLGVSTGIERNFFQHEHDAQAMGTLIHTGFAMIGIGLLVWGSMVCIARDPISFLASGSRQWGLLILCLCIASTVGVYFTILLVYLRNRGRAREYLRYSVGGATIEAVLTVVFVTGLRWGVWGVALGQGVARLATVGVCWWHVRRELPWRVSRVTARELLGIGLPLIPRMLVGVADTGIDRLMVHWLHSLGQVGIFGLANRVGYMVFSALTTLEHVYIPNVYRKMFEGGPRVREELWDYLAPYCYGSFFIPTVVVLFADEVLHLLVGPAFYDAQYPLMVLVVYYGQMFFGKIVGAQFNFRKKLWYTGPLAILRLAIHGLLAILWIPAGGVMGAAWALLVTGIVIDGLAVGVAQREQPIAYDARFVLVMLALLYGALGWSLVSSTAAIPYPAALAGKLGLLVLLVLAGSPWFGQARLQLGRLVPVFSRGV